MTAEDAKPENPRPWMRAAHLLLALYWLGIFTLTHVPRLPPPPDVPQADKWAHLLAYALLAVLYFSARSTVRPLLRSDYAKGLLIFVVYGAADELLQIPVGRSAEFLDWLADVVGALVGTTFFILFTQMRQKFGVGGR